MDTGRSPHLHRPFRDGNRAALGHPRLLHKGRHQRRWPITRIQLTAFVEELFPPVKIAAENLVEFRLRGNGHHALVEDVRRSETLRIPGRNFPEHAAAMLLAEYLDHQIEMSAHHA